jgi:predicted esterase
MDLSLFLLAPFFILSALRAAFAKVLPLSVLLLVAGVGMRSAVGAGPPDCVALDGTPSQPNPIGREGRIIVSVKAPAVRLMRAAVDKSKGTALIFPSGGYHVLSVISDGTEKAQFWNGLGYDAAILEYTISEKSAHRDDAIRDRALQDALASVRLVRGRAKELDLHEGIFVMMGGSAGAHLAARTVAALPEKERPDALVLFYPAYLEEVAPGGQKAGLPPPAGKLPRLFVAIATNDDANWIAGARAYAEAWNKAPGGAGRATFHLFDDGHHGFRKGTRAAAQWPELLKSFEAGR